jgi:ketosteroid isomerase-like protein
LRRLLVVNVVREACEALNRGDLEAAFMLFDKDVETIYPTEFVPLGLEPVTRSRHARIDFQRRWNDEWGHWKIEPMAVYDLGDQRLLVAVSLKGSGLSSGAPVADGGGFLVTFSAGRVIREEVYFDRDEALQAAGLLDA